MHVNRAVNLRGLNLPMNKFRPCSMGFQILTSKLTGRNIKRAIKYYDKTHSASKILEFQGEFYHLTFASNYCHPPPAVFCHINICSYTVHKLSWQETIRSVLDSCPNSMLASGNRDRAEYVNMRLEYHITRN